MVKGVAFDFDGVIAETTHLKSVLFLEMFKSFSEYPEILAYEMYNQSLPRKEKIKFILEEILKKYIELEMVNFLTLYKSSLQIYLSKAPLITGFKNFYLRMSEMSMPKFIVSSGVIDEILPYLNQNGLRDFEIIYDFNTPKSVALKKIYSQLNIQPEQLLFFGDNLSDYHAAGKAGCKFVAINPNGIFPSEVIQFKNFSYFDETLLL